MCMCMCMCVCVRARATGQNEVLKPEAKPAGSFKGEDVFLRSDVCVARRKVRTRQPLQCE
jgi:hypothetical protein